MNDSWREERNDLLYCGPFKDPSEIEKVFEPTIYTDGGPWARHNMPCSIYKEEKALLNLNEGIFYPSGKAQDEGWMLIKVPKKKRILRWIAVKLFGRKIYFN